LLFLGVIIRVVEAFLYTDEHRGESEGGGLNNLIASLHIIGVIVIHGDSESKSGCVQCLELGRTTGDCKEINSATRAMPRVIIMINIRSARS